MDKKLFNKSSNFFKKEGFYVILFVCLCIVATVAAVTARNNKIAKNNDKVVAEKGNTSTVTSPDDIIDNAEQVKKPTGVGVVKNSDDAKAVSKTVDMSSAKKPIAGAVAVKFSEAKDSIVVSTAPNGDQTLKNFFGMFIKVTNPDTDYVCAVLDGKVEEIVTNEYDDGVKVVINHQNGYKTVYANLDKAQLSKLTKNQAIKQGDKIGKVGKSSGYLTLQEKYGKYLFFQVLKNSTAIDPQSLSAFKY